MRSSNKLREATAFYVELVGYCLEDRQRKMVPNLILYVHRVVRSIDINHELFATKEFQDRLRLGVKGGKSIFHSALGIIDSANQLATAYIASAVLRSMVHKVVIKTTLIAEAARHHSHAHDFIGHLDMDDCVDVKALKKELGLRTIPGKAVENETKVPIMFFQATPDDLINKFVAHEFARAYDPIDAGAQLRVILDVPSKNIADADVNKVKVLRQHLGLRALAAALHTNHHVLVHTLPVSKRRGGNLAPS